MRLVFLGSPPFATPVLRHLLASPFVPELVVTTPDRPRGRKRSRVVPNELAVLARENGLDVAQPPTVREEAFLADLRAREPEVVLVAAYGEYLPRAFREVASRETLNVHPSLLPRHRGASPIQAALRAGDEVTGVSIQRVVAEMDAGDVLVALETPVGAAENAAELGARLAELGGEAAVRALERVESGRAEFVPQDPAGVTECRKLSAEDSLVDWAAPARAVHDLVRALNPWPLARTTLPSGAELRLLAARLPGDAGPSPATTEPPGTVLESRRRLLVQAGDGPLELLEVQQAGKKAMPAAAWLAGARLEPGVRLGGTA